MAKKKESESRPVAESDLEELSAAHVLTRVLGVGLFWADVLLSEVSEQDRSRIVEFYAQNDAESIRAILDKSADELARKTRSE